eukprot:TRINITY_DN1710_c0_g1_i1.p2 TRINITY_DN1710_c0_g1~~TRINITY_DN1710_c0_g1_i1.p2  ORF type:complete len:236 (+),score=51.79 TRINITY_DN1710_c0_g1_i1:91-798(+)
MNPNPGSPTSNFQANRPTHPLPERPQRPAGAGQMMNQFHHRTIARNSVAMEPFNLATIQSQGFTSPPTPPSTPLPPVPTANTNANTVIATSPTAHTPELDLKVKQLMEAAKPEVTSLLRSIKIDTLLTGSPLKRYVNGVKTSVYMKLSRDKKRLELRDIVSDTGEININQCPVTDCIEVHRLLSVEDSQLISNDPIVQNIKKADNVDMALFFSIIHSSSSGAGNMADSSQEGAPA